MIELMSQKFLGENFFVGNYKKRSTLKLNRPFTFLVKFFDYNALDIPLAAGLSCFT